MKFEFSNIYRALAIFLFAISGAANAVTFSGAATSFTPGSGYGSGIDPFYDTNDPLTDTSTLLNVDFAASGNTVTFDLPSVGSFVSGVFGTVTFNELYINSTEAAGNLGVTADYTFTLPFSGVTHVIANGTAAIGHTIGGTGFYSLTWTPLDVSFGDGGLFQLDMDPLTFQASNLPEAIAMHTQDQIATITLLATPVPEPEIYAMLGAGLGLMGWVARRRRRQDATA